MTTGEVDRHYGTCHWIGYFLQPVNLSSEKLDVTQAEKMSSGRTGVSLSLNLGLVDDFLTASPKMQDVPGLVVSSIIIMYQV